MKSRKFFVSQVLANQVRVQPSSLPRASMFKGILDPHPSSSILPSNSFIGVLGPYPFHHGKNC